MSKPVVYISGPFSQPDPIENTRKALEVADSLMDVCAPLVPHLTLFWDFISPKPYSDWLALDQEYLAVCDAVFRIPGESPGADEEVEFARSLDIPVFDDETMLRIWAS